MKLSPLFTPPLANKSLHFVISSLKTQSFVYQTITLNSNGIYSFGKITVIGSLVLIGNTSIHISSLPLEPAISFRTFLFSTGFFSYLLQLKENILSSKSISV